MEKEIRLAQLAIETYDNQVLEIKKTIKIIRKIRNNPTLRPELKDTSHYEMMLRNMLPYRVKYFDFKKRKIEELINSLT